MTDTLYLPDTSHEDYGVRRNLALSELPARQLGPILDLGWCTGMSRDARHLWMAISRDKEWGLCPQLANLPETGRTLLLRGVSANGNDDPALLAFAARQRHFFGRGVSIKLAMPVVVSDTLHHVGRQCAEPA